MADPVQSNESCNLIADIDEMLDGLESPSKNDKLNTDELKIIKMSSINPQLPEGVKWQFINLKDGERNDQI